MKIFYLSVFCAALLPVVSSLSASAALISPQEALGRLNSSGMQKIAAIGDNNRRLVYTAETQSGQPAVYIFSNPSEKGYMMLSADDAVLPLLGYSDSGSFDPSDMPEQMRWWLGEYARQIEYARSNNLPEYVQGYNAAPRASRESIAPLLKTRWNQTAPFNLMTPVIGGKNAPAGCVATAMAQVMKYWNYPQRAKGTGTISTPAQESIDLGEKDFQWNEMLDSYSGSYTAGEADAVAYLMKACGYAVGMIYNASSSGAFSYIAALSLIENFGYNPELQYCTRDYYSASSWEQMVYDELAAGRPVLYGGLSSTAGHEFVCDGYAGDGYFHFNWGWSGMGDGYFILDSLNPGSLGTGGGEGGGFNYMQNAIIGVQPDKERVVVPHLVQFGVLNASAKGLDVDLYLDEGDDDSMWANVGVSPLTLSIGVAVSPAGSEDDAAVKYIDITTETVDAPEHSVIDNSTLSVVCDGITGNLPFAFPALLADGRYKVTVVTRPAGSEVWTPVLTAPPYYNFIYMTKKGNSLTMEPMGLAGLTLDSAELLTPLYYGCLVKMKVVVTNNSGKELTGGFYPKLFYEDAEYMYADGVVLSVPANTTVTEEFITTFRLADGQTASSSQRTCSLLWYDPVSDEFYGDGVEVTLSNGTGSPSLTIDNFGIEGSTMKTVNIQGIGVLDVLTPPSAYNVGFRLGITCKSGFFGYPLYVAIFDMENGRKNIGTLPLNPLLTLEAGETGEFSFDADMSALNHTTTYAAIVFYQRQNDKSLVELAPCPARYFQLPDGSGISEIDGALTDDSDVRYYNLQGMEVTDPRPGMLLIRRTPSASRKIIF